MEDDESYMLDDDDLLITRFRAGDEQAFDRLMSLHIDRVYSLAWGVLHDREEALDAAQEVFIKLNRALPGFPSKSNLSAWLYRVCLNHCIDRKRRRRNVEFALPEEDWERFVSPERADPGWLTENSELGREIRRAVDSLPDRQRMVFILRHYELMSLDEIAAALGCSTGAVKAHLARATSSLRDRLESYVYPRTGRVERYGQM
jgi:RNA polymerase sigma-70 factor (ECF subfamily)